MQFRNPQIFSDYQAYLKCNFSSTNIRPASLWIYLKLLCFCMICAPTQNVYAQAGTTWTPRMAAEENVWTSVTYGNGLFVAVSQNGTNRVMTSPDGITWTPRMAAEANRWAEVTFGNGLFVAVSENGTNRVMTSPDGITWTPRMAEANIWRTVTFGNNLFVALSDQGTNRVMTSLDGITWTPRMTVASAWFDVTYGDGLFVAVSYSATIPIMTSPDGITWTPRMAADANSWPGVTYGNGLFVAVGDNGTNRVITSGSLTAQSLDFDGTNDRVNCGGILAASYTKEVWINVAHVGNTPNIISGTDANSSHALWLQSNALYKVTAGHSGKFFLVQDPNPVPENTWVHYAVTYNATSKVMKLYKNGVEVSSASNINPHTGGNLVSLGALGPPASFKGKMDEVRIWNYARSASDIQCKMNVELSGTESGLVAYYNFNQGTAGGANPTVTTLQDLTSNNNDGTLTGFALTGSTSNWVSPSPALTGTGNCCPNTLVLPGTIASGTYSAAIDLTSDGTVPNSNTVVFKAGNSINLQPNFSVGQSALLEALIDVCPPTLGPNEVYNPTTGKVWMDRNLGATQVATSSTDTASYGHLYQWGRGADGHQLRTSGTTSTLSTTDTPGNGNFIITPNFPYDWRSPQNNNLWQGVNGINNPCPAGYRLPTEMEWVAEKDSWSSSDAAGAIASPLKLPLAGVRIDVNGSLFAVGVNGYYWSSTVSGTNSRFLFFRSSDASMPTDYRGYGISVRCIKD